MTKKKKLIIISGITGAIGNAIFTKYAKEKNTIIYGISRKAKRIDNFIDKTTKKLYVSTIIFSINKMDNKNYLKLSKLINYSEFSEINYIHALGLYPFEINKKGEHRIENDLDKDGINDTCKFLTYTIFKEITSNLIKYGKLPTKSLIFGGLADKYKLLAHTSWWKTIEKTKRYMKKISTKRNKMFILNISSIICTHEIITRPYVFASTKANSQYWLSPEEVANKVQKILKRSKFRYSEQSIYNIDPKFEKDYYTNKKFNKQKILELFNLTQSPS